MRGFAGRVALVTGAASGIGRALARYALGEQMKVVLADVEQDALANTASLLARYLEREITRLCQSPRRSLQIPRYRALATPTKTKGMKLGAWTS